MIGVARPGGPGRGRGRGTRGAGTTGGTTPTARTPGGLSGGWHQTESGVVTIRGRDGEKILLRSYLSQKENV